MLKMMGAKFKFYWGLTLAAALSHAGSADCQEGDLDWIFSFFLNRLSSLNTSREK